MLRDGLSGLRNLGSVGIADDNVVGCCCGSGDGNLPNVSILGDGTEDKG